MLKRSKPLRRGTNARSLKSWRRKASNSSQLTFSKGTPRETIARRKRVEEVAQIVKTYDEIQVRDGACILFGRDTCDGVSEMNEHPSRAKTRGMKPDQRFNVRVCVKLCSGHHRTGPNNYTAGTLTFELLTPLGFESGYRVHLADGRSFDVRIGHDGKPFQYPRVPPF